jgi:hypothetical protein
MRSAAAVLAVLTILLVVPGTTWAADSSVSGYGGPGGDVLTAVDPSPEPSSSKSLPFTGADLVPTMIVGVLLVGAGFGVRRTVSRT